MSTRAAWIALVLWACNGDKDGGDTGAPEGDADTDADADTDTDADADADADADTDTDTDAEGWTLHFHGTGYDVAVGQTCYLALKTGTDPEAPAIRQEYVVPKDGTIDVTFENAMLDGAPAAIAWYFDANGSGDCSTALDPVWMYPIGVSVTADEDVQRDASPNTVPEGCAILNGP